MRDIPGPKDGWMIYCWFLTCLIPNAVLRVFGFRTPEQRRAWREKMGLLSIIASLMAIVGYVTFGFTQTVCGRPVTRFATGTIDTGSVVIHGYDYDFTGFNHPTSPSFPTGKDNPLFGGGWNAAGNDISFMFQQVGGSCTGLLKAPDGSSIPGGDNPQWYFPCNIHSQKLGGSGPINSTNYNSDASCHTSYHGKPSSGNGVKIQGQVFYTWDQVADKSRNLAVYEQSVLDFDLLKWIDPTQITYPDIFKSFMSGTNATFHGKDLSMYLLRSKQRPLGNCLEQLITVGFIDTNTIGCVASKVVLYVSLVFIIGVVGIRFGMAVVFAWFFAHRLGNFSGETRTARMARMAEIENWTNDIYKPAPSQYRPTVAPGKKKSFLPVTSRFTPQEKGGGGGGRPTTLYGAPEPGGAGKRATLYGGKAGGARPTPPDSPALFRGSRSSTSLTGGEPCPWPLVGVVPQPPADYEPFGFPLMHMLCLVTAYSESAEGLRTTLDSVATTDYPNSHKLILVIADGLVKGEGNDLSTPDIVLGMMKDLLVPADEVEPHSYVAIADGHKRHNMAKVYAGFYAYDDATVERSKQQRVPVVLVAKVGNPREAGDAKPGNRGKRDSQIVLMSFLQKVMFDERMTTFEYEFFNALWRVAGITPDHYELVLCVDADTKVFPDSLARMTACMAQDEEVMGLCGETKIANKAETWVTMIQGGCCCQRMEAEQS
jgi:chitin synthase